MFVCCLVIPARASTETVREYVDRGDELRKKGDYNKAIEAYTQALAAANPKDANETQAILMAYVHRGRVWERMHEFDKAIADCSKALELAPKDEALYVIRGAAWMAKGDYDKAIADASSAVALDPNYADAYNARGEACRRKGLYDKAISDAAKAVSVEPKNATAYYNLAGIYATCPERKYRDGKKAIEYALKADELREGKDFMVTDALAAAYAESGDFAKARESQEKAIELAPDFIKPGLRVRLELYKQGIPYHQPPVKK